MAATIDGTNFSDTVTNTAGSRYLEGQPQIGLPRYELQNIASPGADGTKQKNFGFRSQSVSALLAFIEATPAACIAAVNTFSDGLAPARFSGTFSGVAMSGLQATQCDPGIPFVISEAGTLAAKCVVAFSAERRA